MDIFIQIVQLILSLSILVIFHEFGHFFFARLFKTRVEKFYLFFNPWFSLFKFKRGDTEYGIGWLPLGGYVKIAGMVDESMDKKQMKKQPEPYEFRSKTSTQRLLIMLGGVLVNFLLACVIYISITYVWGKQYLPMKNLEYGIYCDSTALSIGLQNGDKIISLDDQKVEDFGKIIPDILLNSPSKIVIERNNSIKEISLPADFHQVLLKNKARFIYPNYPFKVKEFAQESPAKEAGIIEGDIVVKINNDTTRSSYEAKHILAKIAGKDAVLTIMREDELKEVTMRIPETGKIGIFLDSPLKYDTLTYGLAASIPIGISAGVESLVNYIKQFKLVFTKEGAKQIGGFIAITNIFPAQWDWYRFWYFTAFLSIMLAFINVLPIPALDGGHVLFLLYEIISGRKPSDKFMEYAQIVGMVILFSLLIFANGNDVLKLME